MFIHFQGDGRLDLGACKGMQRHSWNQVWLETGGLLLSIPTLLVAQICSPSCSRASSHIVATQQGLDEYTLSSPDSTHIQLYQVVSVGRMAASGKLRFVLRAFSTGTSLFSGSWCPVILRLHVALIGLCVLDCSQRLSNYSTKSVD